MEQAIDFSAWFRALWSHDPFPWQRMLAERLVEGEWPKALDLPTAAGKTACIDVALYALAAQAAKPVWERTAPRRIWFVVDRRIVVDEAFERARVMAEKLGAAKDGPLKAVADRLREIGGTERPLAVGRLRGGVLRDDGWARLPSQPAVITSTVDQLGSRLLFRGYGRSALAAPIFAGLAAHDSLILLDEAHLSVPFLQTLQAVERYRGEDWAEQPLRTPFAFAILSATPPPGIPETAVFPGADRDAALDHPELKRRIAAAKPAELVLVKVGRPGERDPLVAAAVEHAAAFVKQEGRRRVAVIVNRVRTAGSIEKALRELHGGEMDIVLLTGRLRPFERDRLVARWKPVLRANEPDEPERPVVLVTTQCIEVGADFSFDALVTEAASLDALRQRFGRLNRLGMLESTSAVILIRDEDAKPGAEDFVYGTALAECWRLLQELAETQTDEKRERKVIDLGIAALDARLQVIDDLAPYLAPLLDAPLLLPSHVDLLCQTSPRPRVEPDIQLYLHGVGRGEAEVRVAWRADLADLDESDTDVWPETVALCPPNSRETVSVPLYRLRQWLADEADNGDGGDVEGALSTDHKTKKKERIRPVLLWQGRDRSRVCTRASEVRPNDVVLLPAAYGMNGLAQSAPEETLGPDRLDIWEPSHAQSGRPAALRLHREVLKPWLSCPPLRSLVELAEGPAWEREGVREAIGAVLDYKQESEDDAPALPEWLLELFRQVRDGRYEQHPAGGLVLRARKAESQEEGEQDLFADDDDLLSATGQEVSLDVHSASVEQAVDNLARRCLPDEFREPLKTAVYWHDVGKLDERFQVMLRQGNELAVATETPLAKSAAVPDSPARRRAIRLASGLPEDFRHEMLSMQLVERFLPRGDNPGLDDLLLHAIASHHGHGRPFAPISLDPAPPPVRAVHGGVTIDASTEDRVGWPAPHALASGVSERFWRLTRRYGWWGLAYLEAILRLGDWHGSRWMIGEVLEKSHPVPQLSSSKAPGSNGRSLVLEGIDGANPLGFLAAVGTLVTAYGAGEVNVRLRWRRSRTWVPVIEGVAAITPDAFSDTIAHGLRGRNVPADAEKRREQAQRDFDAAGTAIKKRQKEIKKRGLSRNDRQKLIESEIHPLEEEREQKRRAWLQTLAEAVPYPELALGKRIDCTGEEYRIHASAFLAEADWAGRGAADLLAAFGSDACLKEKSVAIEPTPFCFISGGGHQEFLDTVRKLVAKVSVERVRQVLFEPWTYGDPGLSMRWDPVEDKRYALTDVKPADEGASTVWMANLLAYRALVLFPAAPTRGGLVTVGWMQGEDGDPIFTWPLWPYPLDPDSIRSLFLLSELFLRIPDRVALRARGVEATFRSRRIKVGTGANFKINFSPARGV